MRVRIPPADCSGLYLIRDGDLWKIGLSDNIRARVSHIRCGAGARRRAYPSAELHSWVALPLGWLRMAENRLHDRFVGQEAHERSWEWFRLSDADVIAAQALMQQIRAEAMTFIEEKDSRAADNNAWLTFMTRSSGAKDAHIR